MKKEPSTKFFLFILQIILRVILLFGLIGIFLIIFLSPITVENYLFKIITGSIISFLIVYVMYIYELLTDQKLS
jgi:hypothetical protein